MAKNKISEWSATAANNTDIGGIDIAEGCAPSGINNAIRELMAQVKDQQTGTDADNFTVGGNLSVTGTSTFTGGVTIGALSTTGNTTLGDTAGDLLTLTGTAISIPNNLNIDSNTLYVDATNNRVGVGKTNPATALDVTGTVTATAFAGALTGAVTGNVTGDLTGNVTGNVTGSSGSCTGNAATATTATNQSGGTVSATTGSFSGQITSSVGGSGISFTNATSNNILWNTAGVGVPTTTTRSAGTKLVLYPVLSSVAVDFAIGVSGATLWNSVPDATQQFRWYGGTSVAATLVGDGTLTVAGTISGSNITSDGDVTGNAATASNALGYNQTWQDVTASRTAGSTYTNNTGRPIFISVKLFQDDGTLTLTVDGLEIGKTGTTAGPQNYTLTAVIPASSTYSVTISSGTLSWYELR